jgi:hypothetical protein
MAEPGRRAAALVATGPELLRLVRADRDAARAALAALDPEAQARVCLEVRPELRVELLMALESPEEVVPLFPDQELCFTARATGMSDAAFLLELATPRQIQACFDLDAWSGLDFEPPRGGEWLDALVEAGPETVARGLESIDPEIWVLLYRSFAEVAVLGKEDEKPAGWLTVDGAVYWNLRDDADPSRVQQVVTALLEQAPHLYWQLVYALVYEQPAECEEWALRWRTGRLADQGFPDLESAMRAYRPLRPEEAPVWEAPPAGALVTVETLPRQLQGSLLGEALAKLPAQRAGDVLGYVLAVANALAVADRMRLSDTDAIPHALEKAVRGIDRGLRELARVRNQPPADVLDRTVPLDLFRIGATLDPSLRPERAQRD